MDGLLKTARADVEESRIGAARLVEEEQRLSAMRGMDAEGEIGGLLREKSALEASVDRDRKELRIVESRLAELSSAAEKTQADQAQIQTRMAGDEMELRKAEDEVEEAKKRLADGRLGLRAAETRAAEAGNVKGEALGRLEAARRTLMLEDPRRRKTVENLTGWTGWVSQLLEVPRELAAAVEAGLGKWAEAAAFEGPVALGNAVERVGGASGVEGPVLMVSARFPGGGQSPARTVAGSRSKVTPLVDLLTGDEPSALAARLLGDVVLVEDWQSGWEVVGSHPHLRAVTRQGDLITGRGVALGGGNRLPDLAAANSRAEEAIAACRVLEKEAERLRSEAELMEASQERMYMNLNQRRQRLLETRRDSERRLARLQEISREKKRLVMRRDAIVDGNSAFSARVAELENRIRGLRRGGHEAAGEAERASLRLEEVSRARVVAEEEYRSKTVALTRLGERRRLEQARFERTMVELSRVARLPQEDEGPDDLAEEVAEIAADALQILAARREGIAESDRAARQRMRELGSDAARAKAAIDRADRTERLATREMEEVIAEISRLEARRQTTIEGLWEMDADPQQALEAPKPERENPAAALVALVAELDRTRPINHYAAADLAVLDEELSQLCDQHGDIVESDRRLGKVISELEKEAGERYMATFRETAAAFEQTFGQVFPGGRGRLRICDPADPLGSGVEIHARPQGKRVSRLSLLSGGERALGALAFLFALMKTRPSPFYLLDEMDATLDAANLHRVLGIVRELRSQAQILIITHQPQTAEFAEVLYGVTMPPGGTTQVVSRRMDRAGTDIGKLNPQARSA